MKKANGEYMMQAVETITAVKMLMVVAMTSAASL